LIFEIYLKNTREGPNQNLKEKNNTNKKYSQYKTQAQVRLDYIPPLLSKKNNVLFAKIDNMLPINFNFDHLRGG
jgi:hypothetical protein